MGLAPAPPQPISQGSAYQGSTAKQDHEDDERLEPVVLDNLEAGPAECPPHLPTALGDVHVEERAALHAGWGRQGASAPHHRTGGCLRTGHAACLFPPPSRLSWSHPSHLSQAPFPRPGPVGGSASEGLAWPFSAEGAEEGHCLRAALPKHLLCARSHPGPRGIPHNSPPRTVLYPRPSSRLSMSGAGRHSEL